MWRKDSGTLLAISCGWKNGANKKKNLLYKMRPLSRIANRKYYAYINVLNENMHFYSQQIHWFSSCNFFLVSQPVARYRTRSKINIKDANCEQNKKNELQRIQGVHKMLGRQNLYIRKRYWFQHWNTQTQKKKTHDGDLVVLFEHKNIMRIDINAINFTLLMH